MEYIKEDVENMLREHSNNERKITEVKLKIAEYKKVKENIGTETENKNDAIEGIQLAGQVISDIPKGGTNVISDITFNTVVNYNKEIDRIDIKDRKWLDRKIKLLEEKEDNLNKKIVRVKNLLESLTEKQKFVIEEYYIYSNKGDWGNLEVEYENKFFKGIGRRQLQNIRDVAINNMIDILNT